MLGFVLANEMRRDSFVCKLFNVDVFVCFGNLYVKGQKPKCVKTGQIPRDTQTRKTLTRSIKHNDHFVTCLICKLNQLKI